jgi:hypothetical protein
MAANAGFASGRPTAAASSSGRNCSSHELPRARIRAPLKFRGPDSRRDPRLPAVIGEEGIRVIAVTIIIVRRDVPAPVEEITATTKTVAAEASMVAAEACRATAEATAEPSMVATEATAEAAMGASTEASATEASATEASTAEAAAAAMTAATAAPTTATASHIDQRSIARAR